MYAVGPPRRHIARDGPYSLDYRMNLHLGFACCPALNLRLTMLDRIGTTLCTLEIRISTSAELWRAMEDHWYSLRLQSCSPAREKSNSCALFEVRSRLTSSIMIAPSTPRNASPVIIIQIVLRLSAVITWYIC